jgi:hypothetical protein
MSPVDTVECSTLVNLLLAASPRIPTTCHQLGRPEMIADMFAFRSTTLPWFFLVIAGLVALLGSGNFSARETSDHIFIWLLAAAVVAAIQGICATQRNSMHSDRKTEPD